MKRLVYALAAIGVVLALYAANVYQNAREQYSYDEAVCVLSGCTATLSWQRAAVFATLAAVSILAALVVSKRTKDLVD